MSFSRCFGFSYWVLVVGFCPFLGGFVFGFGFGFACSFSIAFFRFFALFEAGANADVEWFLVQGF